MAKIQVLPDKLVNLIAAGEVIERPASVVKELVENSLDAGACRITIETAGGGRDFIRVTDDGCGIPKAELSLAVKRHATSKLQSVEQLWRISTLGFRGEALASISEVAHVELASKTPDSDVGWALRVSGGRQEGLEPSGLPQGTQVTVEDLFFNTPARAKYLGKQSGENRQIIKTVQDLALANPAVAFRLVVEGELRLSTPGDGSYLSAAGSIFGPEFAKKLITVSYQGEFGSIIGWVGVPGHYGSNRQGQVFAINGRVFRHTPFTYVVESVFKGRLPVRRFPVFMLNIQIDAAGVDVNVHPTKQEVKFRHEVEVRRLIYNAVYEAISGACDLLARPEMPQVQPEKETYSGQVSMELPQICYRTSSGPQISEIPQVPEPKPLSPTEPGFTYLGQVGKTYLVWEQDGALVLMDQHAAHERVLFEGIITAWRHRGKLEQQELLFPEALHLAPAEYDELWAARDWLAKLGYTLEEFGTNSLVVRSVPVVLGNKNSHGALKETLLELAATYEANLEENRELDALWQAAAITACRGAIKAGDVLEPAQAIGLIKDWLALGVPTCPHGRPIIKRFDGEALAKMFARS